MRMNNLHINRNRARRLTAVCGLSALLHVFMLAANIAAAAEKITVAAFEYPPIYQNGQDKGLSGDIVVAAFKAVDIDADIRFLPVSRMIRSVSDGRVVCGIGGEILFAHPEIAPNVTVSSIIQFVSQTFLYDIRQYPQGMNYRELSDMAQYRIGVLAGSGIMKFLERTPQLKLVTNTAHEGTARQLHAGRVDVWAIVDVTGIMHMKKLFPSEIEYYTFTRPFHLGDVRVVFSKKKDPDNRYNDRFKKGLAVIKQNGTYMQIMAKYYGSKAGINRDALTEDMR